MQQIPSIDLGDFLSNNPKKREYFVHQLGKAYEQIGFVALKGHFLDAQMVDSLYSHIKAFFDLPLETKKKYELEHLGGQRGYTSFGKEHAKGRKEGDLKEFWHFGQYNAPQTANDYYPHNILIDEIPEFNQIGEKVFKALEKSGKYVLRAIGLYLNLEEYYFDPYILQGNSILRPIHYPPITQEPKKAERAAAHGDINLITLLMGAQGKGLQVLTPKGEWIDAIAQEDELIINVGDMLARLTNNKLKSTIHRVVNPPKESWAHSRYSIPFFMHPISSMRLDVLENCIDAEHPKQYDDISAGEFLNQRLYELGLLKKD